MDTLKSVLRAATTELAYPRCVAECSDYRAAQNAVDRLIRAGIAPHEIAVVGGNLRSVERVIARTKLGAAARFGAVLGAWCGLAFAVPLLLATDTRGITLPVTTAVLGALVGLAWATIEHALLTRGGARSFVAAPTQIVADHYEVQVEHRHAERACEVLRPASAPAPTLAS